MQRKSNFGRSRILSGVRRRASVMYFATIAMAILSMPSNLACADEAPPHGGVRFLNSTECALCHSFANSAQAMRDSKDRNVAPFDLWSGSMMANSARDPYWRAVLSAEVVATPSQKAHIEAVCTRCHAPMAAPVQASPRGQVLAFLNNDHPKAKLSVDGVSCTVCHQISSENLGTDASFTGGFVFNKDNAIYGPHANPVTMPMQRHVGYTPTQSNHITSSAMCATCHTVITGSFDNAGQETHMKLHEQVPYLEWRNSIYNDETIANKETGRSCQSCHMPTTDVDGKAIATRLAHNPAGRDFPFLDNRQPFGRHTFAGGNVFMTKLIRDNRAKLGIKTPAEAFDRTIDESHKMLQTQTAVLALGDVEFTEKTAVIPVNIENLSGHKLPTAYPSRRAWVEFTVRDSSGKVVFASGLTNKHGQMIDTENQVLATEKSGGPIQPHFDTINQTSQVQIYETFMEDSQGKQTFALLHGSKFAKDNRILPKGWSATHPDAEATRSIGTAADGNFQAGRDQLEFHVPLAKGTYRVTAKLKFQSLSPRYMDELFQVDTKEVREFRKMYTASDLTPETIAEVSNEIKVSE